MLERLLKDVAPEEPRAERSAAAYALFGMMNWIYNWYDPAGEIDPDRLAGLIARIFVGGFVEARSTVQGGCSSWRRGRNPRPSRRHWSITWSKAAWRSSIWTIIPRTRPPTR